MTLTKALLCAIVLCVRAELARSGPVPFLEVAYKMARVGDATEKRDLFYAQKGMFKKCGSPFHSHLRQIADRRQSGLASEQLSQARGGYVHGARQT